MKRAKKSLKISKELQNFIKKRKGLVWYVKDVTKLNEESIVEHVLNFGDWKDVQEMIRIMGIKRVAKIFWKESKPKRWGRTNYRPSVVNLFNIYFKKYARKNSDKRIKQTASTTNLLTHAAKKASVLSRRRKWKDYVDLYFIMKGFHSIGEISKRAEKLFGTSFNERIFREQLVFFSDIDCRKVVKYMKDFKISNEVVKRGLEEFVAE
jgi:hypothetical protein